MIYGWHKCFGVRESRCLGMQPLGGTLSPKKQDVSYAVLEAEGSRPYRNFDFSVYVCFVLKKKKKKTIPVSMVKYRCCEW